MATLGDLLRLGRPHFLVGGLAFLAIGLALALRGGGTLTLPAYLAAQAFVTSVQAGVHYGNEFHDLAADRLNRTPTRFAGGSRVLLDGRVPAEAARSASRWALALAVAAALATLLLVRPEAGHAVALAATQAAIVVLAFGYSAPPLRLHSRGLGELAAGAVVAGLVPWLAVAAAGASPGAWALVLAPPVLQVAALVTALSLPDAASDAAAGKRTLAVRLGPRRTRRALQGAWLACGLASTAAITQGAPPAFALAGGASFALAVALPVLVLRRSWDVLALAAVAIVALQWALTMASLLC